MSDYRMGTESRFQLLQATRDLYAYTRNLYTEGRVPKNIKEHDLADIKDLTREFLINIDLSLWCLSEPFYPPQGAKDPNALNALKAQHKRKCREEARKLANPLRKSYKAIAFSWHILLGDAEKDERGEITGQIRSAYALRPIRGLAKYRLPIYMQLSLIYRLLSGYLKYLNS